MVFEKKIKMALMCNYDSSKNPKKKNIFVLSNTFVMVHSWNKYVLEVNIWRLFQEHPHSFRLFLYIKHHSNLFYFTFFL